MGPLVTGIINKIIELNFFQRSTKRLLDRLKVMHGLDYVNVSLDLTKVSSILFLMIVDHLPQLWQLMLQLRVSIDTTLNLMKSIIIVSSSLNHIVMVLLQLAWVIDAIFFLLLLELHHILLKNLECVVIRHEVLLFLGDFIIEYKDVLSYVLGFFRELVRHGFLHLV